MTSFPPSAMVVAIAALALAACNTAYQDQVAATCEGIATDQAYEDCEDRVARSLADQRLDFIVRSQSWQR